MRIKRRGGYNVPLAGRPTAEIEAARPEPRALYLPLAGPRLSFSEVCVREGERVRPGQVLARDAAQWGLPLLAPRAGTVRLKAAPRHIVLEDVEAGQVARPVPQESKRRQLVDLGAWPAFTDAHTGAVPDPGRDPGAILVSTVRLEPFLVRGDVLLRRDLEAFSRGLEHLQSLLEYQPMYLVMPEVESALGTRVREGLRGHAFLQVVTIPLVYPMEHPALVARSLGLKHDPSHPVWAIGAEGVLAAERALGAGAPVTDRIIAVGGPAARRPRHLRIVTGYPLEALREGEASAGAHLVAGGALTGRALDSRARGLDAECLGLVALEEVGARQLFGWIRPGWSRTSYSRTFLSALRPAFPEAMPAALRGERRACVACGQCEEVCPARLMPHAIHKALYEDALDRVERLGVDLCIGCGLCAYVCPSKIELRDEMVRAQGLLVEERRHAAEAAEAAAKEAR
jgi:Na+-transporting NADH:ubiquinone oxidoreductase subunit A